MLVFAMWISYICKVSYICMHAWEIASVVSDSVWPFGRQPTRLICPQDSLGKHSGVGCHFLLPHFPKEGKFPSHPRPGLGLTSQSAPCTNEWDLFHKTFLSTQEAPENWGQQLGMLRETSGSPYLREVAGEARAKAESILYWHPHRHVLVI